MSFLQCGGVDSYRALVHHYGYYSRLLAVQLRMGYACIASSRDICTQVTLDNTSLIVHELKQDISLVLVRRFAWPNPVLIGNTTGIPGEFTSVPTLRSPTICYWRLAIGYWL